MKADIPNQTDGLSAGVPAVNIYFSKDEAAKYKLLLERANALDLVNWLSEEKKITLEQAESFKSMLNSPDLENFYLAIEIIKVKTYGTEI